MMPSLPAPVRRSGPSIVLTAGRFGDRVGERLVALCGAETIPLPHTRDALQPIVARAAFIGVAVWRPYPGSCDLLDALCFEHAVPWSVAEVHAQRLTCGPLVLPGRGACYRCYRRRWLSHHKAPDRERVVESAYALDHDLGAQGFIGPMVEIAAQGLLADMRAGPEQAGRLRFVDVLSGAVLESSTIGIHECPRCRPRTYTRVGERFVRSLVPEVERLLG